MALIIGAGDATGGAIARRLTREGLITCVTRRDVEKLAALKASIEASGGTCHAFGSDARDEDAVVSLFANIEANIGPIAVLVFNVGGNVRFGVTETTARIYRKAWEMCALRGFLNGREATRCMLSRRRGTIIFTGATASVRPSASGRGHLLAQMRVGGEYAVVAGQVDARGGHE